MPPEESFNSFSLQFSASAFRIKSTVKYLEAIIPQLRRKPGYYLFSNVPTIPPSKFDPDDYQNFGFEIEPRKHDAAIDRNVPHASIATSIAAQRHLPGPLLPVNHSTHQVYVKCSIEKFKHTIAAQTSRLSESWHTYLEQSSKYSRF